MRRRNVTSQAAILPIPTPILAPFLSCTDPAGLCLGEQWAADFRNSMKVSLPLIRLGPADLGLLFFKSEGVVTRDLIIMECRLTFFLAAAQYSLPPDGVPKEIGNRR